MARLPQMVEHTMTRYACPGRLAKDWKVSGSGQVPAPCPRFSLNGSRHIPPRARWVFSLLTRERQGVTVAKDGQSQIGASSEHGIVQLSRVEPRLAVSHSQANHPHRRGLMDISVQIGLA